MSVVFVWRCVLPSLSSLWLVLRKLKRCFSRLMKLRNRATEDYNLSSSRLRSSRVATHSSASWSFEPSQQIRPMRTRIVSRSFMRALRDQSITCCYEDQTLREQYLALSSKSLSACLRYCHQSSPSVIASCEDRLKLRVQHLQLKKSRAKWAWSLWPVVSSIARLSACRLDA